MLFHAEVPNAAAADSNSMAPLTITTQGINVYSRVQESDKLPCVVLLASHYDTKQVPGIQYLGANDSGSSTVVILEILRRLAQEPHRNDWQCNILLVYGLMARNRYWKIGMRENESILQKFMDNTYGSRFFVNQLKACKDNGGLCSR